MIHSCQEESLCPPQSPLRESEPTAVVEPRQAGSVLRSGDPWRAIAATLDLASIMPHEDGLARRCC